MKSQQKCIEETLEFIRNEGYYISADEFLQKTAKFLTYLLEVKYVLINKYSLKTPTITETVVVCKKDSIQPNFSYELANTPCENVINKDICVYPSNIQSRFPKDKLLKKMNLESYVGTLLWSSKGEPIGLIALLDSKPIRATESIKVILQIVAIKVEKTLEKILFENTLALEIKKLETEKTLRIESEERYRGLSEASFEAVFMSVNRVAVEQNAAAQKMFGYTNEEIIGVKATDIIALKDHELVINKMLAGCEDQYEVTAVKKDGTHFPAEIRGKMTNYKGRKVRISTFNDISSRKKLEITLKKSEEKFKNLANLTFEGIIIYNKGVIVDINHSFEKMFGYKREELIGKDIIHMLYPKKYHHLIRENRNKDNLLPIEIEGIRKDGTIFPIEIEGRDFLTEDNSVFRVGAIRNLTEKNKIKTQTNKLTTAVEQSANTIVITDIDGNIEYVNPKFTEITGFTLEEAIGKNPRILNSGKQPKEYYAEMWKIITAGKTWHGEFQNKSKCGTIFWEQVTITPIKNEIGEIINYLAVKEDITKRKKIEDNLKIAFQLIKENEDYLSNILKITNEGFWVINLETKTKEVNPEMCKILGYSENEILEKSIFDFVDDENTKIFKEQLKNRTLGLSSTYEIELKNSNGSNVPCLFKTSPIYNNKNNRIGSFAMVTDISTLKKAQELSETKNDELLKLSHELSNKNTLLIESKNQFKNLFKESPVSIWEQDFSEVIQLINSKGIATTAIKKYLNENVDFAIECISKIKIINVNQKTLELLGVKNKEDLITHIRKTNSKKSIKIVVNEIESIVLDHKEFKSETEFIHTNGTMITAMVKSNVIDNKGKVITSVIDITALKKAKEQAEESELYFRTIYDSYMEPISIMNIKEKTYVGINDGFTNLMGYKLEEVIGKKPSELNIWVNAKDSEYMRNELKIHGILPYYEAKVRTKSGAIKIMILSSKVFKYKHEAHILTVAHDITQLKQIEQELIFKNKELLIAKEKAEESDNLKTEFLNNMSHEIRTPMNGILGFSEMLNEPDIDIQKRSNFVNIIQSSGYQLLHIIDDILEISRLGTKQVKVIEEEVCINDVLLELFSIFDIKAKENKTPLYLKKALSDKESTVISDKTKLNKVLSNLLENALKFTNNGFIEFGYTLKNNKTELEIYVKDTGIGIKPEKQELIFKRFAQAEKELAKKVGGLGLGLSIAKENTELLGGKITVKSEIMEGATFFVNIPFKPIYTITKIEENNNKYIILIVEDEEVNYIYLETILKDIMKLNCDILHAKNGREAIDICQNNATINIVLMDLKMPILNGFIATKKIREFRPNLPIIAQTAYSTNEEREEAINIGCNDFLSKPIEKDVLVSVLDKFLINQVDE